MLKVRVYHSLYGCGCGCCGHTVELSESGNKEIRSRFKFIHPYGDEEVFWARNLAEEIIRNNWPECLSSIDWDSIEIEVSND